jgi:hypothetical protein
MHRTVTQFALSLSIAISLASQAQPNSEVGESLSPATPYRISFERGESVPGVAASQAIAMPFESYNPSFPLNKYGQLLRRNARSNLRCWRAEVRQKHIHCATRNHPMWIFKQVITAPPSLTKTNR